MDRRQGSNRGIPRIARHNYCNSVV